MSVLDDVLATAAEGLRHGPVALATLVGTSGSAPLPAGAAMVVTAGGAVSGSVSSGCVESVLHDIATQTLDHGRPSRHTFGITDPADPADPGGYGAGLTCGGQIEVFVQRLDPGERAALLALLADLRSGAPTAVATVLEHPEAELVGTRCFLATSAPAGPGTGGGAGDSLHRVLERAAQDTVARGETGQVVCDRHGDPHGVPEVTAFVQSRAAPPRLVVVGAVDFAAALAGAGRFLGYDVTVCDARQVFTTAARFADAHRVVVQWPDRYLAEEWDAGRLDHRSAVCVLTHEERFDVPVLVRALAAQGEGRIGYVGAMGSRRTHVERVSRLRAAGVSDAALARLRSPIGLDLDARSAEEVAVSIVAEMIADRRAGSGLRLSERVQEAASLR